MEKITKEISSGTLQHRYLRDSKGISGDSLRFLKYTQVFCIFF
jgi:hypothetical protein